MKKIVFFSIPGHGHINPTLSVVRELAQKGYIIIYYSSEEFKPGIEAAGALFMPYVTKHPVDSKISRKLSILGEAYMKITEDMLPNLLLAVRKTQPDFIIHDGVAIWGKIIAQVLDIPAISLVTTFAFNENVSIKYPKLTAATFINLIQNPIALIKTIQMYKAVASKYHVQLQKLSELAVNKEGLNIVFTSKYFQPCVDTFDATFKFVGPSIYPRMHQVDFLEKIDQKKKMIYISIGTVNNDNLSFYQLCINTFRDTPYQIILSLGHRFTDADLPPIPENIVVRNHIPQLEILQKADIFISHAGMNSTNESMYYGVPMITVPQIIEQKLNALRVQELGAGIYIRKNQLMKRTLLHAVEKILATKTYYDNAKNISKTLHQAGGYKKAVKEIVEYIDRY